MTQECVRNSRKIHAHIFIYVRAHAPTGSVDMTGVRLLLDDYVRSKKYPEDGPFK